MPSVASMHLYVTTHIGSFLPDLFATSWSPSHTGLCQIKITLKQETDHVTGQLHSSHWLPVTYNMKFKDKIRILQDEIPSPASSAVCLQSQFPPPLHFSPCPPCSLCCKHGRPLARKDRPNFKTAFANYIKIVPESLTVSDPHLLPQ
jgi:hypothetical protein